MASTPGTLPRRSPSSTRDDSCQLTSEPSSRRVWWIPRADTILIVYTGATRSVNTQTWVHRPPPPLRGPRPPPRPRSGAGSSLASNALASFSSNNVSEPRQAVASLPNSAVWFQAWTHIWLGLMAQYAARPHQTPRCVVFLHTTPAIYVWLPDNLFLVRLLFCAVIRFGGSGRCEWHLGERHTSPRAPDELFVTIWGKYFSCQHSDVLCAAVFLLLSHRNAA